MFVKFTQEDCSAPAPNMSIIVFFTSIVLSFIIPIFCIIILYIMIYIKIKQVNQSGSSTSKIRKEKILVFQLFSLNLVEINNFILAILSYFNNFKNDTNIIAVLPIIGLTFVPIISLIGFYFSSKNDVS